MWWRLVLYVSFASACLASLECMFACMPACLFNSTITLSLMVVKGLKPDLYYFPNCIIFLYSYWSPISVSFSCIRTDPLYRFCFPDSDIYYAYLLDVLPPACDHVTPVWYHLTPDSCMLSPDTCFISLITCYLIYYHLTCDYHILWILSCLTPGFTTLLII